MPFDIGFIELCVILVVGLIFLGPDKLPIAARTIGRWMGSVRRTMNSFKSEVDRELEMDELKRLLQDQQEQISSVANTAKFDLNQDLSADNKSDTDKPATDASGNGASSIATDARPANQQAR